MFVFTAARLSLSLTRRTCHNPYPVCIKRYRSHNNENSTFPLIVVRLSLRSYLCSNSALAVNATARSLQPKLPFVFTAARLSLSLTLHTCQNPLSWICSTLTKPQHFDFVKVVSVCSLSGLVSLRPSANPQKKAMYIRSA